MEEILHEAGVAVRSPRSTITPGSPAQEITDRALELLARLASSEGDKLVLRETLGEGGMGIVHLAQQRPLDREVAVKTLKQDARSPSASLKLLREAFITGALEHPNVVPVYDVALEPDGSPRIVLKKIAGQGWDELIRDARAVSRRFHASDLLEWNLRILVAVANAIHFAHARGIVHRDLKPENVMIGEFGEVYVLDWGIAVALRDDGTGRFPLAHDAIELAGTPCYMAPEMLGGRRGLLSTRSDVYSLGALLYEIVVGRAPHRGETLMEILHDVVRSRPEIPGDVPEELARIVRRAMDPDPDARFESVEQLRLAVTGYLEHRGSRALAAEARAALAALHAERARGGEDVDQEERRVTLHRLFAEARFGFMQAQRAWRGNDDAAAGLVETLTTMIDVEIELGDPRAAAIHLGELESPSDALVVRVRDARSAWEAEERRREALARDYDPSAGRRTRVFISLVSGVVWTIAPWLAHALEEADVGSAHPHLGGIAFTFLLVALALCLGVWARESISRTLINRRLAATLTITLTAQIALFAGTWALGISFAQTQPLLMLLYAFSAGAASIAVDSRLWPSSLSFLVGFALSTWLPDWVHAFESAGNLLLTINFVMIWGDLGEDLQAVREGSRRRRQRVKALLRGEHEPADEAR